MVQRFHERLGEASSLPYWSSVIQDIYQLTSRRPEALAVTDGELEWTYGDLRERSDSIAALLADRGIARGSVVGMHLPRCADASGLGNSTHVRCGPDKSESPLPEMAASDMTAAAPA